MRTKHMITGLTAATVMALAGQAHAGLLGGSGNGGFGGGLAGGLGGFHGVGDLASQGGLNGSLTSPNREPATGAVKRTDGKAADSKAKGAQTAGGVKGTVGETAE